MCASLHDMDYLRNVETEPTKLLMLDSDHKIWCWEPTRRGSVPYIMPGLSRLNGIYHYASLNYIFTLRHIFYFLVTWFFLGVNLTVVTEWGEVYTGQASLGKPLVLCRVPGIQNAHAVFTDFKAHNFAYIQKLYK